MRSTVSHWRARARVWGETFNPRTNVSRRGPLEIPIPLNIHPTITRGAYVKGAGK